MVNKIVQMILTEARTRPGKDPVANIYAVDLEVRERLYEIMDKHREEERRNKENESKNPIPK